jgi:adhesin transport system outer membrane protein
MSMKFNQFALSAAVTSLLAFSQTALSQSLTDAVQATIQSNPIILAETNRSLSVDQTIDQAKSGYYPKVDLNLGIGRERSDNRTTRADGDHRKWLTRGEAGLTATQMLYDGYATKSAVEQSESLAESAGYSVADTTESTSLNAIKVYLDVLRRQELLGLTEANLASHERIFSQIKLRSDSGVGSQADLDQSSGRVSLSQANHNASIGNLEDAKTSFLHVVGEQPSELQDPTEECCNAAPATLEDAINIAYHQHPALRSAIADHEAALAQEQGAHAPMQPRVDLEVSTTANNDLDGSNGHNNDVLAMVRMRYNLLNGGADTARINQTGYISEQVKAEALLAKREIEQSVRLAWNELQRQTDRLHFLEQRVTSSEKTRDAYQQQFNLNQRTLLDLLDTENEMLSAQTDLINARYDRIYACYWLSESMGELLATLGLSAPEQALTIAQPEQKEEPEVTTN